jgi:hypothetical protein
MKIDRSSTAALVGGSLLIGFGILSLAGQLFRNVINWSNLWPFTVIIFGTLFFAGMFLGGKQVSGLAIPGSIFAGIGLLLLYQNLTSHWESWSYGWTLIILFVGIGIYLSGLYGGIEGQKRAGVRLIRIGFILFVIFGAFFEMIFSLDHTPGIRGLVFPVLLILLGIYLIVMRLNLLGGRKHKESDTSNSSLPPAS